jgi:DNA-binding CsgD family transcriptional regulator
LPGLQVHVVEVNTYLDLVDCISTSPIDVVVVNPTFGGVFDPSALRSQVNYDFKIMSIEIGVLDRQTRSLYDDALSIVDDMTTMVSKIKNLCKGDEDKPSDKEPLSQREKEIIKLLVKGLTNKEIADQLCLSVYTVNTHRRNISNKLQIHSATGLTIYAIVNQLVDLSEISLG